jgi:Tfp pilus tip-associated adhesin PilY1
VLLITDGDETCNGSPCTVTSTLKNTDGVLTYVVAFGLQGVSGNTLSCMATNGGTGAPIYPQNKDELVAALTQIFGQIREQASSFASAAVPTVQTEVADKIYISNFTPLNGESIWNGHIDSYLKPLPLNAAGLPDRARNCPATGTPSNPRSACHLWDAAAQILNQAPRASDLATVTNPDASALHIGLAGQSQRRIFYSKADPLTGAVPRAARIFAPPLGAPGAATPDPEWTDIFQGLKVTPSPSTATERSAAAQDVKDIMKTTVVVKSSTIQNGTATPTPVDYVLGDTFHADPTIVDRPSDFDLYAAQLYKNSLACGDDAAGNPRNPSYKCWADKHKRRRKMLAIAANDGQLHFFDAGIYRPSALPPAFDDGTGYELFSYMPRLALPIVRAEATGSNHIYGVDSTPRVQEVFIDPSHNGTPAATERQWRTVAIGGFREGGRPMGGARMTDFVSGYYALDITQPDTVDVNGNPSQGLVPSCLTLENTASAPPTGCGPVAFPAVLWEFTDSQAGSRLDEDGDLFPDLGQTWSVPTVGRIQLKNASNVVEDRYVAIFGGGMDAERKSAPKSGSYLYIVDIETGKILYKQKLSGAVPADPAVVDANSDGVLDTIYIGSTAGFLYKIDMRTPVQLQPVVLATNKGIPAFASAQTVQRITDASWLPKAIFDTSGKPIYYPAVPLFVPKLETDALVFGTGDREDLWNINGQEGRFYVVVDDGMTTAPNESSYVQVSPTGATTTTDLLVNPPLGKKKGWYMRLPANERVIAKAFGLSGLLVFSSYEPQLTTSTSSSGPVCGRTGTSRAYTLYLNTARSVVPFQESDVFIAPPTVDIGGTKNPSPGGGSGGSGGSGGGSDGSDVAALTPEQVDIMENLKSYFPSSCRFGNYWYTVSAMGSDTRFVAIAAVPICFIEHNWKEVQ